MQGGDDDVDCGEETPLVLEAVHALHKLNAGIHAVPMRAVMQSTAAADGNDRSLFERVGGTGAAAVAFLRRWPQAFSVQQMPGGGWKVQLQIGAARWLLRTQHFRQEFAECRGALLAAVQEASAAAEPGERRGVEIGRVGNKAPHGFMTPTLMQYRQVRDAQVPAGYLG
jgi:hypothetical protein